MAGRDQGFDGFHHLFELDRFGQEDVRTGLDGALVVFPAAAMGSTLLALNILGDGLRDALDPKMKRQ